MYRCLNIDLNRFEMEHTSAISAQRLIGPLAFLDVIYQHVHRTLKSRHIKDWCAQYGSSVWDPSSILLQEELEKVQKRAARFVTGNYIYETGSMTGILEQLKWESPKKRRRDSRIIMLSIFKGLKGAASIPTNDLVPPIRHVRNHHSLACQTPFANTHGREPTSHHVILMIGYTCYFWKSCAIRVRLCLIFPLILVRFALDLKQIPRKNY